MFGLLFAFLGIGTVGAAVSAAASHSASSSQAKKPNVVAISDEEDDVDNIFVEDDIFEEDHMGHDDGMDTVDAGMDDDHMGHDDGMDTVDAGMDDGHMGHDDGMDTVDAGMDDGHMGHDDGMDTVDAGMDDDHMGHDDGMVFEPITPPETEAEIDAFVEAVLVSPEMHVHDAASSKMGEHMAALDLVPRDEITHIAIGHGDWDDPANWYSENGDVPGDDARVLIPEGIHMTYDHVSDARLFTLRVDGKLEFATDVDSQMVVDTIVISPSGTLQIGTEANPVDSNVNVDIIFANNGAIDTNWDPMLLSRGMIAHGTVEIHGAEKDSHEKVIDDPEKGDFWVDFGETPEGWAVGDTIVIAGTHYDGYKWDGSKTSHFASEDEVRVITQIEDGQVFFDEPLVFDHDSPREDLKTSVANYTRNVSFETENAETAEIFERGHVMFMHNDDVDVRYAEFHELGRTDKSETALNVDEFDTIEFDTNVKGRYSFHFHKAGVEDLEDPAIATGNAVYGSPGWGFVHHDSNAILDNNATFDTFGAGYVAESGNETGAWTDNIAIYAQGVSWAAPKNGNDRANFDLGKTGDGFWFQGRMVESSDNIAASVNTGFVYYHRGGEGETKNIAFDSELFEFPEAFYSDDSMGPGSIPILSSNGNETFAAKEGLHVVKANPEQGHDIHSIFEDFTAWSVKSGAYFEYTAHYTIEDFDLTGKEATSFSKAGSGISFGPNTLDMTIVSPTISGFETGINLTKASAGEPIEDHNYTVIDADITNVTDQYGNYDPSKDVITTSDELPYLQPDIALDGPLTYVASSDWSVRGVSIDGTKTDSLGETEFVGDKENFQLRTDDMIRLLETDGYYETSEGENYFVLDIFFSDRLTSDIYLEKHPVFVGDEVSLGENAIYNGVQDLDGSVDDPTFDSAMLWATLTEGQVILTDEALAMEEEEEDLLLEDA